MPAEAEEPANVCSDESVRDRKRRKGRLNMSATWRPNGASAGAGGSTGGSEVAAATNASISTHGSSLASVSVAAWAAVASSTPAVNGRHLLNRWYDQFPPQQSPSLVVARLPAVRVRALYQRRRARVRRKKISVTYATFERQALCLSPHNDCRGHFPAEGSITCADAPLARRLRQVRSTDQGLTRLVPGAPRPPTGDPNTREMHRNLPAGQIAVRLPARSVATAPLTAHPPGPVDV